jgi:hypothetical protein
MSEIETKAPTEAQIREHARTAYGVDLPAPEETPAAIVRRHIRAALEALTRCPEGEARDAIEHHIECASAFVHTLIKAE